MTKTGQGISEEWVDDLIRSNHFIAIYDYYDALDCFNGVEIKGGVNYFLYSGKYNGKCSYRLRQNSQNSITSENVGFLDALGAGIVIRDAVAPHIIDKIKRIEGDYFGEKSFAQYVGPQHFFDKDGLLTTSWTGFVEQEDESHSVKYYLNKQVSSRGYAWIRVEDIPKNLDAVSQHKIYLSKAYNGGDSFPHQIIGKAFYGEPNSVCSQTYLVLGYNANFTKQMCENIISYMSTRFFRYMVFIKKKTQDNPSAVFEFVPMQDFSRPWTEVELYNKYGLTENEIKFIEATVKPME